MKNLISKRAGYAIHGLAFLAAISTEKQVYFKDLLKGLINISGDLSLSESYVAKIFNDLSRADFVRAYKGVSGGYSLSRPAKDISLLQIIEALDGKFKTENCLLCRDKCKNQAKCSTFNIIKEVHERVTGYLKEKTIEDISKELT